MSTHDDTEPITPTDALNSVGAISDVAITTIYRLRCVAQGSQHEAGDAVKFRRMGDLLYSYAYTTPAATLWRAADQIDPPTVPAEPDLNTPEGWIAEAKRADEWSDLPTAFMGAQMNALSTALSDCPEAGVAVKLAAIYGYSSRAVRR